MVKIVWDEPKRRANLDKHGLDFKDFESEFRFEDGLVLAASPSRTGRARIKVVGPLLGRLIAAILSPLGSEAISIVSLRIADLGERRAYDRRP